MLAGSIDARVLEAADAVLRVSPAVRYVAIADGETLHMAAATGRAHASASETDYYEERLVNPVMLELARRRGSEGCGGFDCIVIRYGRFWQLLLPARRGHVSVCIEPDGDPFALLASVRAATADLGTAATFDAPAGTAIELMDEPFVHGALKGSAAMLTDLYGVAEGIRYVAIRRGRSLVLSSRVADPATSDDRSDRYEELIVNPTLLELSTARGSIDCGGVRHLTVAYPGFFALVLPIEAGHVTVSLGRDADPVALAPAFERVLEGS